MGVNVHESRRDDGAVGVDAAASGRGDALLDRGDEAAVDGDVGGTRFAARAVNDKA